MTPLFEWEVKFQNKLLPLLNEGSILMIVVVLACYAIDKLSNYGINVTLTSSQFLKTYSKLNNYFFYFGRIIYKHDDTIHFSRLCLVLGKFQRKCRVKKAKGNEKYINKKIKNSLKSINYFTCCFKLILLIFLYYIKIK